MDGKSTATPGVCSNTWPLSLWTFVFSHTVGISLSATSHFCLLSCWCTSQREALCHLLPPGKVNTVFRQPVASDEDSLFHVQDFAVVSVDHHKVLTGPLLYFSKATLNSCCGLQCVSRSPQAWKQLKTYWGCTLSHPLTYQTGLVPVPVPEPS